MEDEMTPTTTEEILEKLQPYIKSMSVIISQNEDSCTCTIESIHGALFVGESSVDDRKYSVGDSLWNTRKNQMLALHAKRRAIVNMLMDDRYAK